LKVKISSAAGCVFACHYALKLNTYNVNWMRTMYAKWKEITCASVTLTYSVDIQVA